MHDDLDILYFLARLNFSIIGETIFVSKDGFGILGHHYQAHFVLDELKAEFCVLQIFIVLLIPRQLQKCVDEFELE
jgi:hypothetical protein